MANFALTIPNERAVFRYAYRDTGDAWSADLLMTGGAGDPDKTFSFPVCDEIRVTATFDDADTFSVVHLSSLSLLSGLSFDIDYGAGLVGSTALHIDTRPLPVVNQTINTTTSASTAVVVLYIEGLAQRSLTLDQVVFGKVDWTPAKNFSDDSEYRSPKRYSRKRTRGYNRQRLEDPSQVLTYNFFDLTTTEFDDLQWIVDEQAVNGYTLIQTDPDNQSTRTCFLADCSVTDFVSNSPTNKSCSLNAVEKNTP